MVSTKQKTKIDAGEAAEADSSHDMWAAWRVHHLFSIKKAMPSFGLSEWLKRWMAICSTSSLLCVREREREREVRGAQMDELEMHHESKFRSLRCNGVCVSATLHCTKVVAASTVMSALRPHKKSTVVSLASASFGG